MPVMRQDSCLPGKREEPYCLPPNVLHLPQVQRSTHAQSLEHLQYARAEFAEVLDQLSELEKCVIELRDLAADVCETFKATHEALPDEVAPLRNRQASKIPPKHQQ